MTKIAFLVVTGQDELPESSTTTCTDLDNMILEEQIEENVLPKAGRRSVPGIEEQQPDSVDELTLGSMILVT